MDYPNLKHDKSLLHEAIIEAGNQFGRFFTGQITAAGKVPGSQRCGRSEFVGGLVAWWVFLIGESAP